MNKPPRKIAALAASGRIANVPSVAGNVYLGIVLANPASAGSSIMPLISSGILLYLAGNFFNDWSDRNWDATHRPERGLPQALFQPATYLAIACTFLLLGLGCASAVQPRSLAIASLIGGSILIYTWVHKRAAWSVIPMGLCRALLPLLGFSVSGQPFTHAAIAASTGLFLYIVALSLSARSESASPSHTGGLRLARVCFVPSAFIMLTAAWKGLDCSLAVSSIGVLPYALWTALCLTLFRKPTPLHVSNLLAGIPFVDWIILLPLGLTFLDSGPLFTTSLLVPPITFLAAKALQRLTPAT